jgi:hypothetical protein
MVTLGLVGPRPNAHNPRMIRMRVRVTIDPSRLCSSPRHGERARIGDYMSVHEPPGIRDYRGDVRRGLVQSRPLLRRNSAVVLVQGNGSSGTAIPRRLQSGGQPSATVHSRRRFGGRRTERWRCAARRR